MICGRKTTHGEGCMGRDEIKVDGLSQFAWAAIPAILAIAGLLWLSFYLGIHQARRESAQEARASTAVGASPLPQGKINVVIANKPDSCRIVDRATLDGGDLWVYWHKTCTDNYGIEADSIAWQGLSPDGTVVNGGSDHTVELSPGQKGEFHTDQVETDPRIASVRVRAVWNCSW